MNEPEDFKVARQKLNRMKSSELSALRTKIFSNPHELSWVNKAIESALLVESFNRTGTIDVGLYYRVVYTVENLEIFRDFFPVRQNPPRLLSELPESASCRILFLSSKFGSYVSSQEYVRCVLERLGTGIEIILASTKPISTDYSCAFETHQIDHIGDLRALCRISKIDKLVDLTGNYQEMRRALAGEVHVADLSGDPLSALSATSSLVWNESKNYQNFLCNPVMVGSTPLMFLPAESAQRAYPSIGLELDGSTVREIRLGAFCRTAKLNLRVVRLWAEIMKNHPRATIKFAFIQSNPTSEKFVRGIFQKFGVSAERVYFLPRMDTKTYLDFLNSIDINLGAMPEQGGISCMDSLVMGCPYPVCDELSNTFTSSIVMKTLGLDGWVADSVDAYRSLIERLISELSISRSEDFRKSIRARLLQSSLAKPDDVASAWNRFLRMAA